MVVILQIVTILISRGDVTFLANLYAFGVIWSFALKGIAVLVLRYTHPEEREFRVPLNFHIAGKEIPLGLALITLMLLAIAVINLFTKPAATVSGIIFSGLLFAGFEISEKRIQRKRGERHVELDQFNLAQAAELTEENVGVKPGNILVPVSNYYALYPLEAALRRAKKREAEIVVLARAHAAARGFGRVRSGARSAFQHHRAIAVHQGSFAGGKRRQAGAAGRGRSQRSVGRHPAHGDESAVEHHRGREARPMPRSPSRRAKSALRGKKCPSRARRSAWKSSRPPAQEQVFYLGPHAPRLTPKEIDLLHKVWLEFSDRLPGKEIHHHDIVHFALTEVEREMADGSTDEVLNRLREHLREIESRRINP